MQVSILNLKHFNKQATVDEVVEHLLSLNHLMWTQDNGQDIHLIMTGGEPLLWQRLYIDLFEHERMQDLKNVTFETNTTQSLHPEFKEYLSSKARFRTTFSCSPKLPVQNLGYQAIKPDIAYDYYSVRGSSMYFKFVVSDSTDVNDVDRAVKEYNTKDIDVPVYLMPLVVEVKNTILQSKMWQNFAWRKVEIHTKTSYPSWKCLVLDDGTASRYTNEHVEDVMKKEIDHSDLENEFGKPDIKDKDNL